MTGFAPTELFAFAGTLLLRATVLLAGALLVSPLLGRLSASARHAFWSVTTVGLLVLPALPAALPALPVRIPGVSALAIDRERTPETSVRSVESGPQRDGLVETPAAARLRSAQPQAETGAGTARSEAARGGSRWMLRGLPTLLVLLLWGAGFLAAVGSLLLALRHVARLAGSARPITLHAWRESFERARARVGVRRAVALLATADASMPLAGGFVRPFVLMPSTAADWSPERRDLVLLHELVHVARHDALRQVVGRLTLALYWFHPLARLAARRALLAREQACDEAVLAFGPKPSVYARHLLELAEPGNLLLPALSLVERPHLEKRVMAILKTRPRNSPRATLAAAACACVWALTVAATTPASDSPQQAPQPHAAPAAPLLTGAAPAAPSAGRLPTPLPIAPSTGTVSPSTPLPAPSDAPGPLASATLPPGVAPSPLLFAAPSIGPTQERTCWESAPGETSDSSVLRYVSGDRTTEIDRIDITGGDRMIRSRDGDLSLCVRAHGNVAFEEGLRIAPLEPGAWLVMGSRDPQRTVELIVTPGPSGDEYAWYVNGSPRPFDAEGAAWRDAMVPVLSTYWDLARDRDAMVAERQALSQAQREMGAMVEVQRARVEALSAEARTLAQADEVRRRAMRQQLDSLRSSVPAAELERARAQLEAAAQRMRDASPQALDSLRALTELRAQLENVRAAQAEILARAERARAEGMSSQLSEANRVRIEELRQQLAEMARATESSREAAAARARLIDRDQLEENLRRLREAIGRIP